MSPWWLFFQITSRRARLDIVRCEKSSMAAPSSSPTMELTAARKRGAPRRVQALRQDVQHIYPTPLPPPAIGGTELLAFFEKRMSEERQAVQERLSEERQAMQERMSEDRQAMQERISEERQAVQEAVARALNDATMATRAAAGAEIAPSNLSWKPDEVAQWMEEQHCKPAIIRVAKKLKINGKVLAHMDAAAWAELGEVSALRRCELIAAAKHASLNGSNKRLSRQSSSKVMDLSKGCEEYKVPARASQDAEVSKWQASATRMCCPVECRCVIGNLSMLQHESLSFSCSIKFEASWEDNSEVLYDLFQNDIRKDNLQERIVQADCSYSRLVVLALDNRKKYLFAPRIVFKNLKQGKREEWFSLKHWKPKDPKVKWYSHFDGIFHMTDASLLYFPFDEQMLTIEVQAGWELRNGTEKKHDGSADVATGEEWRSADVATDEEWRVASKPWNLWGVDLRPATASSKDLRPATPSSKDRRRALDSLSILSMSSVPVSMRDEFNVSREVLLDRDVSDARDSSERNEYSKLLFSMHVSRKSRFLIITQLIPNFIITSSVLASYGEPAENLSNRLEVTVTILVALTAFKYLHSNAALSISIYVLVCFIFVFAVIVWQFLAKVGIYEEQEVPLPSWLQPNASSASAGGDLAAGTDDQEPIMIAQPFLILLGVWLIYHCIIVIVVCLFKTWQQRSIRRRLIKGKRWGLDCIPEESSQIQASLSGSNKKSGDREQPDPGSHASV